MRIILFIAYLLALVFIYAMCKTSGEADKKYEELSKKKLLQKGAESMEIDFSKVKVAREQELIELVQSINADIEIANCIRPIEEREEALKLDYILGRYRTIKNRENAKAFKEKHECRYCMYYAKPRRCFARKVYTCISMIINKILP